MDGRDTLYSSKETISSPLKSFLHQHQTDTTLLDDDVDDTQQTTKLQHLKNLVSKSSKRAKNYLSHTFDELKEKYEERKQWALSSTEKRKTTKKSETPNKKRNESRIFVTRSSKEFAQIKVEENNLTSSLPYYVCPVVGACIVALPYAIKQSGLVLGILLIFLVSISLDYSEYLLIQCSIFSEERHVPLLAKQLFGKIGYFLYFGVPYIHQFSLLLAYFIVLGDTSTKCVNSLIQLTTSPILLHRNIVLLLMLLVIVPVSLTRNVKRIFKLSMISLAASALLMVLVMVRLFTLSEQIPRVSEIYRPFKYLGTNIIQAISVVTFALSCQHSNRLSYMSVNTNKELDPKKPTDIVAAFTLMTSVVVAGGGYTTFNVFTQGNILENYCEEDLLASVARVAFTCFVVCLFPLECQNIRYLTDELVLVHQRFQQIFHIGVTLLILLPVFTVSLFMECLPLIMETAGVLLTIPMVFVLPAVLFLRLFPGKLLGAEKLPCLVFLTLGITFSVSGLAITIFSSHNCIHSTMLFPYCNGSGDLVGPLITLMSLNTSLTEDNDAMVNFNMSQLERYGFENLTDVVNAYLA